MYNLIDSIVLLLLLIYFTRGWMRGFLKTIFGPIALILASIVSYIYFKQTNNLVIGLVICLIGPFILEFLFSLGLKLWNQTTDEDEEPFTLGRLAGGFLSLLWGGIIIVLCLVLTTMIPLKMSWLENLQARIKQSTTYGLLNHYFHLEKKAYTQTLSSLQEAFNDPQKLQRLEQTEAFQDLINDDKLRNLLQNEDLAEQLKGNNLGEMIKSQQIQEIIKDKDLVRKFLSLYAESLKLNQPSNENTDE